MSKLWPKRINIIAENDPHAENGVSFRMEDQHGFELTSLVFSKDQEPGMNKKDHHEVRFKLIKQSGMTLEFAPTEADALCVVWGTKTAFPSECPKAPMPKDPIFYATKSNGNTLVAINTNPDERKFNFTLNFVDPHSSTPHKLIPYDPPGDNQDGGIGDFDWSHVLVGVGSAVMTTATIALAASLGGYRLLCPVGY